MTGLNLVGLDDDGSQLVLTDAQGARFTLPVTDELRRAVRHAMATTRLTVPERAAASTLSPREIQQRLRAGLTPEELAELTGEPLAAIEKFSAPVLAERRYVIEQAQATRIGRDSGAPVLVDLVVDRVAARHADTASLQWDAWREADEPWRVSVTFRIDERTVRGVWTFDHGARSLTAEDDESRWLTETELLDAPIPRRHLSAVRVNEPGEDVSPTRPTAPVVDRVVSDGAPPSAAIPMPEAERLSPTEALLEELGARRGRRDEVELEDDDEGDEIFEGFGPAVSHSRVATVGFGGPGADPAETAESAHTSADREGDAPASPEPGERRPRKGRASVPSWDEIVFGTRQQDS